MAMRRCAGGVSVTSTPSMKHWPSVISSSPAIILSSVDLPQPDGPEQCGERAFLDREAQIGDRRDRAVALGHAPQFDMRRGGAPGPRKPGAHPLMPADSMIACVTRRWKMR